MNIKIGKYYNNKTRKFLLPCFRTYNQSLKTTLNSFFKLAVGIDDHYLKEPIKGRNIFILYDSKYKEDYFLKFMSWIKETEEYVTSYNPCEEGKQCRQTMLVLKIPKSFENSYDTFLKSLYSEMYSHIIIDTIIEKTEVDNINILKKHPTALTKHINDLQKIYNIKPNREDAIDKEYDYPLINKEEIFNYKGKNIYFDPVKDKRWE